MKFRSIKSRTLVSLLPTFIVVLLFITLFTYFYGTALMSRQIEDKMNEQLKSLSYSIEKNLVEQKKIPEVLARGLELSSSSLTKTQYEAILKNTLNANDGTFAAGIFFEPYKHSQDMKYFSMYAFHKEGKIEVTDEFNDPTYDYPNKDWYKLGKESRQTAVYTDPYLDPVTNVSMVTVSVPFYSTSREFLGVMTCDIDLSSLQKFVGQTKVGETGHAFLLDDKGTYLVDEDTSKVMKMNIKDDANPSLAQVSSLLKTEKKGMVTYKDEQGMNRVYYMKIPENAWTLALVIPEREMFAPIQSLVNALIVAAVISLAVAIVIILLYSRYITGSITRVNELSASMSAGDFTHHIPVQSRDEFGQMFHNFNSLNDTLRGTLGQIASHTHQVASTSEQLTAGSEQTSKAAEQITESMVEVASGTDQQASIVEDTRYVVAEITEDIDRIAEGVEKVNERSMVTAEKAENGNRNAKEVTEQMNHIYQRVETLAQAVHSLGKKSEEIDHIVALITTISEQTNLLALNAAIEAARAGEHGRGFSVVADEVRKLAEQSSQSAHQISGLISQIQHEMRSAVEVMNETNTEVKQGIAMVDSASDSFEDILQAAEEVFAHVKDVTSTVKQMDGKKNKMTAAVNRIAHISEQTAELTQEVAASAEEQNASMEEIASASLTLTKMAEELHDVMNKFKV
ncbi:methyl-accepting chemotaxis protein [Aneurinibacillus sp. REN35]|uniref:methyl-accepting chemotaxis protein n=1 Tax=Aneurinibacillus sp. REN35 TaxID=3237286 RepID=UPI0035280E57